MMGLDSVLMDSYIPMSMILQRAQDKEGLRRRFPDDGDLVFAGAFGFEHGVVGLFKEFFGGLCVEGVGGQPAADGERSFSFGAEAFKSGLAHFPAEPFGHELGLARMLVMGMPAVVAGLCVLRQIPEDNGEFIAAQTCDHIVLAAASPHEFARLKEYCVADGVAVGVVIAFEIVQVEQQQCYREAVFFGVVQNRGQELVQYRRFFRPVRSSCVTSV